LRENQRRRLLSSRMRVGLALGTVSELWNRDTRWYTRGPRCSLVLSLWPIGSAAQDFQLS
jgi:hypothetical protein